MNARGARPTGWTLPAALTVYAWDAADQVWTKVYEGPSDAADDGSSPAAAAVTSDAPAGLGTWAWWFEQDAAGQHGRDYWQAPDTTAGKSGPRSLQGA